MMPLFGEPRQRIDVRYFELPNGMLCAITRESRARMSAGSPEWEAVRDADCRLSGIRLDNSRMMRAHKGEMTYGVREIRHQAGGELVISGFTEDDDCRFLHLGMNAAVARKRIAVAGLTELPADPVKLREVLDAINRLRRQPGFPTPGELSVAAPWVALRLPNQLVLHLATTSAPAGDRIGAMVVTPAAPDGVLAVGLPDFPCLEVELINLRTPVLSRFKNR